MVQHKSDTANELIKYGAITYSKMASFSRPCCPCDHEQLQAHRHVHTDRMSHVRQQQAAAAQARAATAGDMAVRAGALDAVVQGRRTWMMSTVTEKR